MKYRGRPLIHPKTIAAWRDWLTRHHADTDGVWLARWKKASGKVVLLEVLGFWRKASAIKHLQYLQRNATMPYLLAVSDDLHIEEQLDDLPEGLHRFRHMPLADEIARLAMKAIGKA